MKKCLTSIIFLLCLSLFTVCNAATPVFLSSTIYTDNLAEVMNQQFEKNKKTYHVQKVRSILKQPNAKTSRYETTYTVTNQQGIQNIILAYGNEKGNITFMFLLTSRSKGDSIAQRVLYEEALILERALGAEKDETINGMYAILDAMKKGTGAFWCSSAKRRYVVQPLHIKGGDIEDSIGIGFRAET